MAKSRLSTLGDLLYWSYANLAMMMAALNDGVERPAVMHFMVRSRLYKGLREGTMQIQSFFDDEKLKLRMGQSCWYCGATEMLSADHIVAQSRGGSHGGENLISSCRSCNSSKGSHDLLQWFARRGEFPPLYLLRRYLKMAIEHCTRESLMDVPLHELHSLMGTVPFALETVPQVYPAIREVRLFAQKAPMIANQ